MLEFVLGIARSHLLRPTAEEAAVIDDIDALLGRRYAELRIDRLRYAWTSGVCVLADPEERYLQITVPFHRRDYRYRTSGCSFRQPFKEGPLGSGLASRIDDELRIIQRQIVRERRLIVGGFDPSRPPASTFCTDLITRRALEYHAVDRDRLVRRGSRAFRSPSENAVRGCVDAETRSPRSCSDRLSAPAMPKGFFDCSADFDIDNLVMWSLSLSQTVRIAPGRYDDAATAAVMVEDEWPATLLAALPGLPLADVIEHPVLADDRIRILHAFQDDRSVVLNVADPRVPLA